MVILRQQQESPLPRDVTICEEANQIYDAEEVSYSEGDSRCSVVSSIDLSSRVSRGTVDFLSADNDFAKVHIYRYALLKKDNASI